MKEAEIRCCRWFMQSSNIFFKKCYQNTEIERHFLSRTVKCKGTQNVAYVWQVKLKLRCQQNSSYASKNLSPPFFQQQKLGINHSSPPTGPGCWQSLILWHSSIVRKLESNNAREDKKEKRIIIQFRFRSRQIHHLGMSSEFQEFSLGNLRPLFCGN